MAVVAASGRERVLDAAAKLFSERSYAEVGVAQILELAQVQAPTLYHHFKDKEGLFVAWAEMAFVNLGEGIRRTCRPSAPTAESLSGYAEGLLLFLEFDLRQTLRDAGRLSRSESTERVFGAYFQAVYEPLMGVLLKATATNELRQEPVAPMADALLGGLIALRRPGVEPDAAKALGSWWANAFIRAFEPRF